MRNQHVMPPAGRHVWRALIAGAALALPATIVCADEIASGKSGRLRNEVLRPAPHDGQLKAPHLSADWWLRVRQDAPQSENAESSKQVFGRRDEQH